MYPHGESIGPMLPWIRTTFFSHTTAVKRRMILALVAVVFFGFVFALPSVHAQSNDTFGLVPLQENLQLGGEDIRIIIARIIRAVLGVLGLIALIIVLYAGFTIMTAGGDEEKVGTGKKILINGLIGLVIIMSSFTIVQFVLTSLMRATGTGSGGGGTAPGFGNFSGAGSLGNIVRDHYPFRDQTNVPRNTKISVTFAEAMDAASIADDTNKSGVFGDCKVPDGVTVIDFARDCDRLKTGAVTITEYTAATAASSEKVGAVVDATVSIPVLLDGATTFVIRPLTPPGLGNALTNTRYRVTLTDKILKPDKRTSAFDGQRSNYYRWEFETGTVLDVEGPIVEQVVPGGSSTAPKNSIVQVTFSEAMDPSTVQGVLGGVGSFTNLVFHKPSVKGEWRISNGYRTVEFISADACGNNSCGDVMYCLPAACPGPNVGANCTEQFSVLIRTGVLAQPGSFEIQPFTGAADMAGNGLDGNANKKPEGQPSAAGDIKIIRDNEKKPDNYSWTFGVQDVVDREAPFIEKTTPVGDQESIAPTQLTRIWFSKPMMMSSLGSLALTEYLPGNIQREAPWYRSRGGIENAKTVATIDHGDFGGTEKPVYYFASVPGVVKSTTQQCLYPGRGPAFGSETCTLTYDVNGAANPDSVRGCVPVIVDPELDTGCVQGNSVNRQAFPGVKECLDFMRSVSN